MSEEQDTRARTFDETFAEHRLSAEERRLLVWRLAGMRARKTVDALLLDSSPAVDPRDFGLRSVKR